MDAHVFPAGAHLEPAIVAAHGTEDAADRAFAAGKDFQRYAGTGESRDEQHETFYRARRAAGSGGSGSVVGSRGDVFVVHGSVYARGRSHANSAPRKFVWALGSASCRTRGVGWPRVIHNSTKGPASIPLQMSTTVTAMVNRALAQLPRAAGKGKPLPTQTAATT